MPRFFFNIHDDDQILYDQEGTELSSLDAARHEALVDVHWMLAEGLRAGSVALERRFEITDEAGQVLATVRFVDALRQLLDGTEGGPRQRQRCECCERMSKRTAAP